MDHIFENRLLTLEKISSIIFKKIGYRKNYENVLFDIAERTKKRVMETYLCSENDIFGVFGKYDDFKFRGGHKESGKKLISRTSCAISKKIDGVVVITGERLYYKRGGKVKTKSAIISEIENSLKRDDKSVWRSSFSKVIGYIPQKGIFFIDSDRSGSIFEEESFHRKDREFGLGIIISNKIVKPCKGLNLETRKMGNIEYRKCLSIDFNECAKDDSKCFCPKLKINKTTISPFIDKKSHHLVFVENHKGIENLVTRFYETHYSN
jgi:hypothetical protein